MATICASGRNSRSWRSAPASGRSIVTTRDARTRRAAASHRRASRQDSVEEYMRNEARFHMVEKIDPARFRQLAYLARAHTAQRVALYEQLARITLPQIPQRVPVSIDKAGS